MSVAWQHKVESWEVDAQLRHMEPDEVATARRRFEAKLDALSDGGWELVTFKATFANDREYLWSIWKRKVA